MALNKPVLFSFASLRKKGFCRASGHFRRVPKSRGIFIDGGFLFSSPAIVQGSQERATELGGLPRVVLSLEA